MRLAFTLLFLCATQAHPQEHSFKPQAGFVPNEATAVAIAEAVLKPIYGAPSIERQRPFKATLEDGKWRVQGSLPSSHLGGVAEAWIAADDGRVLRVTHGQ